MVCNITEVMSYSKITNQVLCLTDHLGRREGNEGLDLENLGSVGSVNWVS